MDSFHESMKRLKFKYYDRKSFKTTHLIGSGYIGEVYSGNLDDGKEVVIKKLVSSNYYEDSKDMLYEDILTEIKIANRFRNHVDSDQSEHSKHLIEFYGYSTCVENNLEKVYILMEKTSAMGDISNYIYQDKYWRSLTKTEYDESTSNTVLYHEDKYWDYVMNYDDKINIMYQMAIALKDLHSYNIVHCDIKPGNMLFVGDHVKLIDFNAAVYMGDNRLIKGKKHQGTPGYMSKQLMMGDISYTADIYSLGVSFLEIWFGDIWPHKSSNYEKCRKYVLDYLSLLKKDNLDVYHLIKECVDPRVKKRPPLDQIINRINDMVNN